MRKVINGKVYDTHTADKLGYNSNNLSPGEFYYYYMGLYRTRKGTYFLYESTRDDDVIKLVDEKEARDWAEEFLTGDEYEKAFGEVEEG